jgi:hypothetical protein
MNIAVRERLRGSIMVTPKYLQAASAKSGPQ